MYVITLNLNNQAVHKYMNKDLKLKYKYSNLHREKIKRGNLDVILIKI